MAGVNGLNFSTTAEDVNTVAEALEVVGAKRIVCICSSGDTPLGLLALAPVEVDAVDISPAQVRLAQLKAAAIVKFGHSEVLSLLGAVPTACNPLSLYESLRDALPADLRAFWDDNRLALAKGILWQGRVQRMLRYAQHALTLLGGHALIASLRAIQTDRDVEEFLDELDRSWRARIVLAIVFGRFGFAALYPEMGRRHLPAGISYSAFAYARLRRAASKLVPPGNPYLDPLVLDRQYKLNALPPYLQEEHQRDLKSRLNSQLRFHVADILSYVASQPPRSVDGFALCNVVDWLSASEWVDLLRAVAVAGTPGARVIVFSRAPRRPLPSAASEWFVEEGAAEAAALRSDRTGYHDSVYVLTLVGQEAQ